MVYKKQCDNLGTLFWETASSLQHHTAITYHGDGQCKILTYLDLRAEAALVREAVRQQDSRAPETSKDELHCKGDVRKGSFNGPVLEGNSEVGGHRPGVQVVGILSSGPEAVACILGVLSSCGFWYISPQYTKREVTVLAKRIRPERILVEEALLYSLEGIDTVVLDTFSVFGTLFKLVSTNIGRGCSSICRPENLAYVVPTSGSTGTPKCVFVPHASVMPNIYDFVKLFKATSEDRVFCAAPLTFDPSIIDLFLAFHVGASLVMVYPNFLRTPRLLLEILVEKRVTILQATPTLFLSLGHRSVKESLLSQGSWLRVLALGGEMFPIVSMVNECIGDGCTTRIFNLYGLTEVSCWASVWEYVPGGPNTSPEVDQIPIGKPLSNTEIKVLKESGEEVENGEEGEIHVGSLERLCLVDSGDTTTEGKALTHLRKTGDLGLLQDGHIYCLGRLDDQVKRNGQKISLREIEIVCSGFTCVSQCSVVPHPKGRLVLFVCLCDKGITLDDIWRDLRSCLAPWKIPDEVVLIDSMPFNAHGKIDTKRLLSLMAETQHPPSCTKTLESFFNDLWRRTLGCEDVREDDHFIFCGGNSLTAVQVTARMEEFSGHEIPEFLDALLHNSYHEILRILQKYQLARKSDKPSGGLNKRIRSNNFGNSKPKQKSNVIELKEADSYRFFSDHQSSKDNSMNGDQEDVAGQSEKILLTAISRRGVQQESVPVLYNLSPCTYSLRWKYDLGKCIDSSPLLARFEDNGTFVFVGSHSHRFACINAVNGTERWCCLLGDRVESSPAVSHSGSFVYVGCYDCYLYCLRVRDGSIVWKYRTEGEVKSSPVVDQETGCVVFGSHDKRLHCVRVTGEANWVLQVSSGSIFSSPCIAGGLVIAATLDGTVSGVDKASGRVKWKVALKKPVFSSLTVHSQGVVFGTVGGQVLSYSLSGIPQWAFETRGSIFSSPYVLKLREGLEVIAIGSHDNCVYFLSHQGELLTKYCTGSPIYATPFLYPGENGHTFGAVVCETHGRCSVLRVGIEEENELNTQRGHVEVMWERELQGELFSSPVFYKNRLWIGCRDDFLYCFDASSPNTSRGSMGC